MPLIVPTHELQSGMRLAEAFRWRGRIMLPGGKVLTPDVIELLTGRYPDAMLSIGDPVLDSLVEFEDDGHDRTVALTAKNKVSACMASVQERFSAHTSMGSVNFEGVKAAALEVMEFLKSNPVSSAILDRGLDSGNPLAEHTGNVFYLCMVLGAAVRDYVMRERVRQTSARDLSADVAFNLLPLGLGAMFMDIGMYALPHLFVDGYELSDEDRAQIRAHPITGADMLPDTLPSGVKMVVRTHHENFDGSGYPSAMAGRSLHVFTRIVRICDAFVAATSQRCYRGAKSVTRAIWEMTHGPWRHCYDPVLAKVFANLIQPFPIGSKLRLVDGRHAVVVRYNRRCPFRPTVIVAFDQGGQRLANELLEGPLLLGEGNTYRVAGFAGEDLSYLHDSPAPNETHVNVSPREMACLIDAGYP